MGSEAEQTVPAQPGVSLGAFAPWAFAATLFLSAALVFSVQPMFAKMVLPRVGGGVAAWTVALAFFQAALLVGYGYAAALAKWLRPSWQIGAHLALLLLAGLFLPISVATGFGDAPSSGQGFWLFALFAASVGLPFVAVSATAPLLQSWYARLGRPDSGDPYHLYAASNAGSLLALLAFPLVIEPGLGTLAQAQTWAWGFALLGMAIALCGIALLRAPAPSETHEHTPAPSWPMRAAWVGLGFLPAALLTAGTAHIAMDVASVPLLWVIPLALYLAAFILAFQKRAWIPEKAALWVHAIAVIVAFVGEWAISDWRGMTALALLVIFTGAYVACRALYELRPSADHLTEFYLWMSLGGVLGGAAVALIAPLIFDTALEWPMAVLASLMARPRGQTPDRWLWLMVGGVLALAVGARLGALTIFSERASGLTIGSAIMLATAAILAVEYRQLMLITGGAALLAFNPSFARQPIAADRSFYGIVRVVELGGYRQLAHGTTLHGAQNRDPLFELQPGGYYGRLTSIGQAITAMEKAGRVKNAAVLGLGTGAMSCYAMKGQFWTFYEIDPMMVAIARNPNLFTYVSRCAPEAGIVMGDARLKLAEAPAGAYDFILVDTFASDSVPVHMMTAEAMKLYLSKLSPNGIAVLHVSNRNLDMMDLAARTGRAAGAFVAANEYDGDGTPMNMATDVVVIAKSQEALAPLLALPG